MLFVDGENFTLEGQKILAAEKIQPKDPSLHAPDSFLWIPKNDPKMESWFPGLFRRSLAPHAERAFYYTTVSGPDSMVELARENLWKLGFHPEVFHKPKGTKAKGVDITLTKDVLCHAFQDNYDVAVIVAGDGDYVPLVKEIKRLGKIVGIAFFGSSGLNKELRLASDQFIDLKDALVRSWSVHIPNT